MTSKISSTKKEARDRIINVAMNGTPAEKRHLFGFDKTTTNEMILQKFKLFAKSQYNRYYQTTDAPFHDGMIMRTIQSYRRENVVEIGFRGSAKTALKKLLRVYLLLNDKDHYRKYAKVLCGDLTNSKQIVTDIYNMMLEVAYIYGNVFEQEGSKKSEETMSSFTMTCGVKLKSGTVGQKQRGHQQDAYRPDWVWFEDIEDSETISSQVITRGVIKKCDEAIQGLARGGSWELTANYISDIGTVQWFLDKKNIIKSITPILYDAEFEKGKSAGPIVEGKIAWPAAYTIKDIQKIQEDALDFWGDYMCDPNRSENKFFDIERIERDMKLAREADRTSGDLKYWGEYQPHHRFGQGSDHSEGIGKDSNALAGFDFNTGELMYTYANNEIAPDLASYEFARVGSEFGNCIWAPEINNKCGGIVITTAKHLKYPNIYQQRNVEKWAELPNGNLGWDTNGSTKHTMFFEFKRDYKDGLIKIYDIEVLKEMKSYTNNDLQETKTTGLITRHFDLLTACCIAWQMKKYAEFGIQKAHAHTRPPKEKKNQAR